MCITLCQNITSIFIDDLDAEESQVLANSVSCCLY